MNSELEDLELDALLEDLQLDKLCLEFDKIDTELNRLLELDEKNLRKLESIRQIRSLERALEVLASAFDRPTTNFFIVLNKLSSSFFKLKKLSKKIILINHFKHLIEVFKTIKYENHLVLLQPRIQSINSIKA